MDDERLRHQRFHKPAGMEQCSSIGLFGAVLAKRAASPGGGARSSWLHLNTNHIIEIRRVIEDGTDRADEKDEFRDLADMPGPRLG